MAKKEMTTDKFEVTNCDLKEGALEQITVHDQLSIDQVKSHIYSIRGTEVMLDRELAQLYGVETKVLNQLNFSICPLCSFSSLQIRFKEPLQMLVPIDCRLHQLIVISRHLFCD